MTFRTERDPLGELNVPADAYYGVQTARAVENFRISGLRAPADLVTATILIKKAAAEANRDLGRLDAAVAGAIVSAADEILAGRPARSVRRRRLSGRRRHLAQHECQRSARQSSRRDARRSARHLPTRAPERSREHGTVDQRRVPGGDPARVAARTRPARPCRQHLADSFERKAEEFARRPEDRPYPSAGRRADHARPGVRRLRGVHPPRCRRCGARRPSNCWS